MSNYKDKIESVQEVTFPYLNRPIEIYHLKNGHKIVLGYKEGGLLNVSSWVKTGSINENDENSGISHFLEHLMFKGTPKNSAGVFDKTLEAKGGIVNAATWKDYTFYYVTLPKGENNENLELVVELHSDMMLNPLIPDEEVGPVFDIKNPEVAEKRERYVVIEEIRMREDQPWTKTYNELNHNMYQIHPYKRDVIGEAEIIATVPQPVIMDYYKKHYTPENITSILVGEIDFEKAIELMIEKFDFKQERPTEKHILPEVKGLNEPIYLENKSKINTGFLMFGFHGPKATNLKDSILLDILGIVMGEGTSSRLSKNLIEKPKHPVFNVIDCDQYSFKDGNIFFINGNFIPEHKETAISQIKEQIENLQKNLIEDDELTKAKKKLKVRFADSAETVSEIGETIGYYMTVCEDLSLFEQYLKFLEGITKEDIKAAAQKYLDLEKVAISVLLPE